MYIKSDIVVFIWKDLILIDDINKMYNYEYNVYDQRNWHTFSTWELKLEFFIKIQIWKAT